MKTTNNNHLYYANMNELLTLDEAFLNDEQLDQLSENPLVTNIENLGFSGRFNSNVEWFSVTLEDENGIDIYYKPVACECLR